MNARDFIFNLPGKVRKEAVEGLETVFHFELTGEDGGDYTLALKDGMLDASEGLHGDPKCTVKASSDNFLKLVNGNLNPLMAILTGKVKVSNQSEMVRYAKIFGLM
ncbi:MAG: SCP2 sterol-binding domain-containing protein [Saprospiraceae bacterium]|nr:SCP2 sterol-binding domain-containing protein [Saprospiraceae bacterium]